MKQGLCNTCIEAPGIFEKIIRLIYPVKCMVCDTILREDTELYLCEGCKNNLKKYDRMSGIGLNLSYIDMLFAAFYYENGIDNAIHAMKYKNQPRISDTMTYLLYKAMSGNFPPPHIDIIIPVPMYKGKKRSRGYNQSELLSKKLSCYLGVNTDCNILVKTRDTMPQSKLKRHERLGNLVNSIKLKEGLSSSCVKGKNILLVDDVITTGTTLNICAKILHEAGASEIFASVIAIASK
jgi:competence protein ComFC